MNTITSNSSDQSAARAAGEIGGTPRWWFAALGVLFLFNLAVFVPWEKPTWASGIDELDASWLAVMNWGYVNHLDFGRDLVFTHGPLGFAAGFFAPDTFWDVAIAWALLATACFAGLTRICGQLAGRRRAGLVFLGLAIVLVGVPVNMVDARMMLPSWLLVLIYFYIDDRPWSAVNVLLAFSLSVFSLVKFSVLMASVPVMGLITLDQVLRRRVPSVLIVYSAGLFAFWLAAGQRVSGIVPYLRHSWELANGYVEALSTNTDTEKTDVAKFVGTAVLLIAAMLAWSEPRGAGFRRRVMGMAGAAVLLFLVFKGGYVRHDVHEIAATAALAIMSISLYAAIWPRIRRVGAHAFPVLLSLWCIWLSWGSQSRLAFASGPENLLKEIFQIPDNAGIVLDALRGGGSARSAPIAGAFALPQVKGSVDIYSWGQRSLLAEGMDYRPRPVFQSYFTCTSELSRLNAEFLAGPRASDAILFELQTIDHHYPAEDDGQAWPEILTRYDLTDATGSRLVLRHSAAPRDFSLDAFPARTAHLMEWVPVPKSGDPIWMSAQVRLTPVGRLMRLIYKPPTLLLGIKTKSGQVQIFRYLRRTVEGGILLSPQISDRMAFAALYGPNWKELLAEDEVSAVAVAVAGSGRSVCYDDQFTVQFSRLRYPHVNVTSVPGMSDYLDLRKTFREMTFLSGKTAPILAETDEGKIAIATPPRSQIMINAPAGAHEFDFAFGLTSSSSTGWRRAEPVAFRIYALTAARGRALGGRVVWSQPLNPAVLEIDRGLHRGSIRLPAKPPILGVLLETAPGPDDESGEPYWTDLAFR